MRSAVDVSVSKDSENSKPERQIGTFEAFRVGRSRRAVCAARGSWSPCTKGLSVLKQDVGGQEDTG